MLEGGAGMVWRREYKVALQVCSAQLLGSGGSFASNGIRSRISEMMMMVIDWKQML